MDRDPNLRKPYHQSRSLQELRQRDPVGQKKKGDKRRYRNVSCFTSATQVRGGTDLRGRPQYMLPGESRVSHHDLGRGGDLEPASLASFARLLHEWFLCRGRGGHHLLRRRHAVTLGTSLLDVHPGV